MTQWIALIRGINVGGNNVVPMKALRDLLGQRGFSTVRTYIQSGNCILDADDMTAAEIETGIASVIEDGFGFRPDVMAFTATDFASAIARNPFAARKFDPKHTHIFFLDKTPARPDIDAMNRLLQPGEAFELRDRLFFLRASNGVGRSKIAARIERFLGVTATSRNLNTVQKIQALLDT
ncbi:MAG: hypothetical protein DHS20C06_09170 [Hyphobacterium sp.]|nr:MAG: hypothetical protein DHS20C06_09170 [Hyphobacterium sp.]